MNVLQKARLIETSKKIGGLILGAIGVYLFGNACHMDGYADGMKDTVSSYKAEEEFGNRSEGPLLDFFKETIEF